MTLSNSDVWFFSIQSIITKWEDKMIKTCMEETLIIATISYYNKKDN